MRLDTVLLSPFAGGSGESAFSEEKRDEGVASLDCHVGYSFTPAGHYDRSVDGNNIPLDRGTTTRLNYVPASILAHYHAYFLPCIKFFLFFSFFFFFFPSVPLVFPWKIATSYAFILPNVHIIPHPPRFIGNNRKPFTFWYTTLNSIRYSILET